MSQNENTKSSTKLLVGLCLVVGALMIVRAPEDKSSNVSLSRGDVPLITSIVDPTTRPAQQQRQILSSVDDAMSAMVRKRPAWTLANVSSLSLTTAAVPSPVAAPSTTLLLSLIQANVFWNRRYQKVNFLALLWNTNLSARIFFNPLAGPVSQAVADELTSVTLQLEDVFTVPATLASITVASSRPDLPSLESVPAYSQLTTYYSERKSRLAIITTEAASRRRVSRLLPVVLQWHFPDSSLKAEWVKTQVAAVKPRQIIISLVDIYCHSKILSVDVPPQQAAASGGSSTTGAQSEEKRASAAFGDLYWQPLTQHFCANPATALAEFPPVVLHAYEGLDIHPSICGAWYTSQTIFLDDYAAYLKEHAPVVHGEQATTNGYGKLFEAACLEVCLRSVCCVGFKLVRSPDADSSAAAAAPVCQIQYCEYTFAPRKKPTRLRAVKTPGATPKDLLKVAKKNLLEGQKEGRSAPGVTSYHLAVKTKRGLVGPPLSIPRDPHSDFAIFHDYYHSAGLAQSEDQKAWKAAAAAGTCTLALYPESLRIESHLQCPLVKQSVGMASRHLTDSPDALEKVQCGVPVGNEPSLQAFPLYFTVIQSPPSILPAVPAGTPPPSLLFQFTVKDMWGYVVAPPPESNELCQWKVDAKCILGAEEQPAGQPFFDKLIAFSPAKSGDPSALIIVVDTPTLVANGTQREGRVVAKCRFEFFVVSTKAAALKSTAQQVVERSVSYSSPPVGLELGFDAPSNNNNALFKAANNNGSSSAGTSPQGAVYSVSIGPQCAAFLRSGECCLHGLAGIYVPTALQDEVAAQRRAIASKSILDPAVAVATSSFFSSKLLPRRALDPFYENRFLQVGFERFAPRGSPEAVTASQERIEEQKNVDPREFLPPSGSRYLPPTSSPKFTGWNRYQVAGKRGTRVVDGHMAHFTDGVARFDHLVLDISAVDVTEKIDGGDHSPSELMVLFATNFTPWTAFVPFNERIFASQCRKLWAQNDEATQQQRDFAVLPPLPAAVNFTASAERTSPTGGSNVPVLISVPVFTCMPCIHVLLRNLYAFVWPSIVVLHLSQGFSLDANELRSFNSSHPFVVINPIRVPTQVGRILRAHITNIRYMCNPAGPFSHLQWSHVMFLASNERFVREGAVEYIRRHDAVFMRQSPTQRAGFVYQHYVMDHAHEGIRYNPYSTKTVEEIRLDPTVFWTFAAPDIQTHDHFLAQALFDANLTQLTTSLAMLEGTFLSRKIAETIFLPRASSSYFYQDDVRYCDDPRDYATSELYTAALLQDICDGPEVRCGERISTMVWKNREPHWTITVADVKSVQCSPFDVPYAIKRFPRVKDHPLQIFSENIAEELIDAREKGAISTRSARAPRSYCHHSS